MCICYSYNIKKLFGNDGTGFMAMDSRTKGFLMENISQTFSQGIYLKQVK